MDSVTSALSGFELPLTRRPPRKYLLMGGGGSPSRCNGYLIRLAKVALEVGIDCLHADVVEVQPRFVSWCFDEH